MSERARVLVAYGNSGVVELANGERIGCKFRRSIGRPYCGDRVEVDRADGNSRVVSAILPRDNEFVRSGPRGQKQAIAANLDQALIVVAPVPEPSRDLLERYLVAVISLGIRPLIVLNKAEELAGARSRPGGLAPDSPLRRLEEYRELGYSVVETSCKGPPGIDALTPLLTLQTSILVGQSGVGKSSLANALLPDLGLQIGALSRVTGKGTHTTTTTIMYTLPCGGRLIDSPGVWEYGLWTMAQTELADGFLEFRPFQGRCRFRDCRHGGEPGCAVDAAVAAGAIREWRYQSYRRLLEQAG
ncbi:MAG: ribosome small subunit-dependent GTPase A [Lysobacterales bacterium]|nr:MAG: ribosome small subunit-dependent GTPase A [Xanthomonadales bacterium]